MTKHLPRILEEETKLSEVARACSPRERELVDFLSKLPKSRGMLIAAGKAVGYGERSSDHVLHCTVAHILRTPRVQAYITEATKLGFRSLGPRALSVIEEILDDPSHKDRARVALNVIERHDPVEQKLSVEHSVKHDPHKVALEYLRHLKSIGASQAMLIAEFGQSGLEYYSDLLAKGEVVDAEFTEVKPALEHKFSKEEW